MKTRIRPVAGLASALVLAALCRPASAQPGDDGSDIRQTVARVSFVQGEVSYARGDDPDNWQGADPNLPVTVGDRLYTGSGSVEMQLPEGAAVRLGTGTDLVALNLTDDVQQFAVKAGVSSFSIPRLDRDVTFEVDTPNAAVTFEEAGRYRIDVDEQGQTRVSVASGSATIAAGGGQLALSRGEAVVIEGLDSPRYEVISAPGPDRWDLWVDAREERLGRARSAQWVSADVVGAEELDEYGRWETLPEYGRVWTPQAVEADWAPYRVGHWYWQDPWGWTWISTEPWGWAPYHYGRWVFASARWYWVPVAPTVRRVRYAPALVAFVGADGVAEPTASIGVGFGVVGWFPLAPRDPLVPWWGTRTVNVTNVEVTNVTYVNRTQVTVVNRSAFVSGAPVSTAVIRERATVRRAVEAPVVAGPVPIAPTNASTRASTRREAPANRPPAAVSSRSVVTRAAPPPAPPRFEQKLETIRENHGAPVAPAVSTRLASASGMRSVVPMRPAVSDTGNVRLAPRSDTARDAKKVEPVQAPKASSVPPPAAGQPATARPAPAQAPPPSSNESRRPGVEAAPAPQNLRARRPDDTPPSQDERKDLERQQRPEQPSDPRLREKSPEPPAPAREVAAPAPEDSRPAARPRPDSGRSPAGTPMPLEPRVTPGRPAQPVHEEAARRPTPHAVPQSQRMNRPAPAATPRPEPNEKNDRQKKEQKPRNAPSPRPTPAPESP